ncbi:MAG TPA: HPr-rel-A system PqqD family peptide chaperone [Burkholderiales bacterium]|nr:HPr-rel-A system PqqD family peptide chaperone [Burkholderiales bacterium]
MRWHTIPPDDLIWRELDGELVVRNARTGNTHLLEPLAAEVLRALTEAQAGLTVADLVARLRDDAATEDEWSGAIEAVLTEFERLGLAEPQEP